MFKNTHILLLDENSETRSRLRFLLNISGHKVTDLPNREDAVNWINNAKKTQLNFDLLLINYLATSEQPATLDKLLNSLDKEIPIVLLERPTAGEYSTTHLEPFKNRARYLVCPSEAMIATVNGAIKRQAQQNSISNERPFRKEANHA